MRQVMSSVPGAVSQEFVHAHLPEVGVAEAAVPVGVGEAATEVDPAVVESFEEARDNSTEAEASGRSPTSFHYMS